MKNKRQDEKVKKKERIGHAYTEIKREEIRWRTPWGLTEDGLRGNREISGIKDVERETKTPTVDGTGVRRGSVSLRHLLTDNLTNLSQFFVGVFSIAGLHVIWMLSLTYVWWWKCQEISVGGVFAFKKCVFGVCLCVALEPDWFIWCPVDIQPKHSDSKLLQTDINPGSLDQNLTEEVSDSLHI